MTNEKPAFTAFAQNESDRETLKVFATKNGFGDSCIFQGDIETATAFLKTNTSPILLLVEVSSAEAASAQLDALADVCSPETKVIIIGSVNEYSFYRWLIDIGIFSYLLRPLTLEMLEGEYKKSLSNSSAGKAALEEKKPAQIISVIGARGGVGASTIALNLSGIFAEYSDKKIALVDIDPQEGTLSLFLDIEPARGLRDALEKPDRIDTMFIDRVMNKPHKNLCVLSAEESFSEPLHISPDTSEVFMKELSNKYDVVVLDIPRYLNQFSRECLKKSSQIIIVAELNLQSLRDTLRLSDFIRDTLKIPQPMVVINRFAMSSKNEIGIADFEKAIGIKSAVKIAYTPDIFMQVGTDIPSVTQRKNPCMKPIYELAMQLVPDLQLPEAEKASDLLSFFKKK